jgi:hypothetical protein
MNQPQFDFDPKPDHYISVEEINELETVFEKADLATVPDTIFQKEVLLWPRNTSRLLMNVIIIIVLIYQNPC